MKYEKQSIIYLQSEGRGHITQAFSLQELLHQQNIGVSAIIIRNTTSKQTLLLLKKRFYCPFIFIESYEFFKSKKGKSVNLFHTGIDAFFKFPKILISSFKLKKELKKIHYDIAFNFYEPACFYHNLLSGDRHKTISIAHQNIYLHDAFHFPKKNYFNAKFLKLYTYLVAASSKYKIALSFYPLSNVTSKNLVVTGPLLRNRIKVLEPENENFILVYLAYSSLLEDIIHWHNKNQNTIIHCFTDKQGINGVEKLNDHFYLHSIDEDSFIDHLSKCKGVVTTAGFESVCEAMYLGKPVMMVPIANHFEQYCNAIDAQKAEAGIAATSYNIQILLDYIETNNDKVKNRNFRNFTNQSEHIIINLIRLIVNKQNKFNVNLEGQFKEIHAQNSFRH
jgi:uncharacterized protein (TIGR00661 family)